MLHHTGREPRSLEGECFALAAQPPLCCYFNGPLFVLNHLKSNFSFVRSKKVWLKTFGSYKHHTLKSMRRERHINVDIQKWHKE